MNNWFIIFILFDFWRRLPGSTLGALTSRIACTALNVIFVQNTNRRRIANETLQPYYVPCCQFAQVWRFIRCGLKTQFGMGVQWFGFGPVIGTPWLLYVVRHNQLAP